MLSDHRSSLALARSLQAITVGVRVSTGTTFDIDVEPDWDVAQLKAALVEKSGCAVEQQRLIYKGRILKDEATLESYGQYTCF
jgi:ubiquilin